MATITQHLTGLGMRLLPIQPKTKTPNGKWSKQRYTAEELAGAETIGVHLTPPYGGWVDWDLDHIDAISAARDILPDGYLFVEKTYVTDCPVKKAKAGDKQITHYIYRSDTDSLPDWYRLHNRWVAGHKNGSEAPPEMKVDLRTGAKATEDEPGNVQTVIAGTHPDGHKLELKHTSGKPIDQLETSDIACLKGETLIELFCLMAQASGCNMSHQIEDCLLYTSPSPRD